MYKDLITQLRATESRSKRNLLDRAAAAIESLEAERAWISVKDRLPKPLEDVLVTTLWDGRWQPMIGWHNGGKTWYVLSAYGEYSAEAVTHWRPLPELPKEV